MYNAAEYQHAVLHYVVSNYVLSCNPILPASIVGQWLLILISKLQCPSSARCIGSQLEIFCILSSAVALMTGSPVLLQDSEVSSNTASGQGSVFNVVNAELVSFNNVTFASNSGQCRIPFCLHQLFATSCRNDVYRVFLCCLYQVFPRARSRYCCRRLADCCWAVSQA